MIEVNQGPPLRFCALGYRAPDEEHALSGRDSIIVVLIAFKNGDLGIRLHQNWRRLVAAEDWEYIRELIDDFKARAKSAPGALFEQAQSLSVGPIVACDVGADAVLNLYERFNDV